MIVFRYLPTISVQTGIAMHALVLLTLLAASTFMQAQEVTYNTTPTHQLGPELWQLPIGGQLTMSRDGKTLLVASKADTCRYVVDVTMGTIRKQLATRYIVESTSGASPYACDGDMKLLAVSVLVVAAMLLNTAISRSLRGI